MILVYFIKSVLQDLKESRYFAFLSVLALISFLVFLIGNLGFSDINPDAAQQAAAGLDSFRYRDLNYTGTAFLGYPARQYLITALPALFFGRSIFTLQLGFALPFILGILLLYCAFRTWAQKLSLNKNLAVLPLYAFFVFPFITEYYTNFEQAIYPVSFTMVAIGFFLLLLCKPNVWNMICFAWVCCLFSNSYTPVLASLGLFLVLVALSAYLWIRKPSAMPFKIPSPAFAALAFLMADWNAIFYFLVTLLNQRHDRITEIRPEINLFKAAGKGIYDFLTDKNAVFLGLFGVIVIIYLIAGLTLCLKIHDFLISLWVLGVIAASDLLSGYTSYQPAWNMQRAMIIIPVIITAVTLTIFELLHKWSIKTSQGAVFIFLISFAFIGLGNFNKPNQSFDYFNYIQPMKYLWGDLERTVEGEGLKDTSEFNLVIYTDNILFKNPQDYCKFLYPNINLYVPENGELPEGIDLKLDTFFYGDNGLPGSIPTDTKITAASYKNKKHDVTGTWFRGILN